MTMMIMMIRMRTVMKTLIIASSALPMHLTLLLNAYKNKKEMMMTIMMMMRRVMMMIICSIAHDDHDDPDDYQYASPASPAVTVMIS